MTRFWVSPSYPKTETNKSYISGPGANVELSAEVRNTLTGNLGMLFEQKCERTKALGDIQNAIKYCTQTMNSEKEGSIMWYTTCLNLANALLESNFRSNNVEDLARAVEYAKKVTDNISSIKSAPSNIFMDAALILKASYQQSRDLTELQQAAENMENAILHLPSNHISRASAFHDHGQILEALQYHTPSHLVRNKTVEAYAGAANCSTGRIIGRLGGARSAARMLIPMHRLDEASHYLEMAVSHLKNACPTWLAIRDRQYIISLAQGLPADAASVILRSSTHNAYRALYSLELSRGIIMGSIMDYRREAKHLEAFSPNHVKQWNDLCMELDALSRGKITDEQNIRHREISTKLAYLVDLIRRIPSLESFSPFLPMGSLQAHELEMASPELFGAFYSLRWEFDSLPLEKESGRVMKRQRELDARLNELESTISKIPGLEGFNSPLSERAMLELARDGPIIVVNCSSLLDHSDAILIQTTGIEVVPLPLLYNIDVQKRMEERDRCTKDWTLRTFSEKNAQMRDMLKWLWQTVVEPVLSHLKILSSGPRQKKPRAYWMGTGLLTSAPFHAAGTHDGHSSENAMSYVISTYVTSLRALSFTREASLNERTLSELNKRLLIVDAPSPHGASALPAVNKELGQLVKTATPYTTVMHLPSATPAEVLRELPLANMAHFACHATSDPVDAVNSYLHLQIPDQTSQRATTTKSLGSDSDKLSVGQISAARSSAAELAFLSACSAAESRKDFLTDESIHIAMAFQLAGFRQVVGTLWQTKDACCRAVAGDFYQTLFEMMEAMEQSSAGEGQSESTMPAAEALHSAVWQLRAANPGKVLAWAPFVHFGA